MLFRSDLRRTVEEAVGSRPRTRYSVRKGLLVEETILDEVAAKEADVVVISLPQRLTRVDVYVNARWVPRTSRFALVTR